MVGDRDGSMDRHTMIRRVRVVSVDDVKATTLKSNKNKIQVCCL